MSKINVSNGTIKVIDEYISADAKAKFINKIFSLDNEKVTVTNTGVVSSGKSSLFNALLREKDSDIDRFAVGAARTTIAKSAEKYSENIELIDTPGIDVKEQDDEVALNAICASSIIMMVHNIKMGMLHDNEVEWLKKIVANLGNDKKQLKDRFIFVNTWIDSRMMEKSFQSTVDETKRILFETLGMEVEVINVSAKLYIQGISNNKQKFVDMSNILKLKEVIDNKAKCYIDNYGLSSVKNEIVNLCDEDCKILHTVKSDKVQKEESMRSDESSKYRVKLKEWEGSFKRFKDLADRYNNVKLELNNL